MEPELPVKHKLPPPLKKNSVINQIMLILFNGWILACTYIFVHTNQWESVYFMAVASTGCTHIIFTWFAREVSNGKICERLAKRFRMLSLIDAAQNQPNRSDRQQQHAQTATKFVHMMISAEMGDPTALLTVLDHKVKRGHKPLDVYQEIQELDRLILTKGHKEAW